MSTVTSTPAAARFLAVCRASASAPPGIPLPYQGVTKQARARRPGADDHYLRPTTA